MLLRRWRLIAKHPGLQSVRASPRPSLPSLARVVVVLDAPRIAVLDFAMSARAARAITQLGRFSRDYLRQLCNLAAGHGVCPALVWESPLNRSQRALHSGELRGQVVPHVRQLLKRLAFKNVIVETVLINGGQIDWAVLDSEGGFVDIRIMFRGLFTKEEKVLEGVEGNGKSAYSDDVWAPADMLYEPPLLEVTQPKGSFCSIHTRFAAALDPDGVYDIVTDPNNHRVFRNIKEVVCRKVLEDDGNRQYVEVEQLGRWTFLIFSGSFATRIFLEQKRREKSLSFDLAEKGGMMRKFSGSWTIEPMRASEAVIPAGTEAVKTEDESGPDPIVGSWVTFQQVVEPTVKPPWPLSDYIRGITEKIVREMLADLQRECRRLSELRKSTTPAPKPAPETHSTPKLEEETLPASETHSTS